jgi:uncharacterized protein YggU (UPF0235/DUF167 family)
MKTALLEQLNKTGEVYFRVRAYPGAPQSAWREVMADGSYRIAVAAVPEKGRANLELIKFLATEFGLNRSAIKIISGAADRFKLVKIKL